MNVCSSRCSLLAHQEVLRGFAAAAHPMTQRCAGHVVALLRQQNRGEEANAVMAKHHVVGAPAEAAPMAAGPAPVLTPLEA